MNSRYCNFSKTASAALLLGLQVVGSMLGDDGIRFNRDIRPILSDKCFSCHGPDKNARKGDLRLDVEAMAKADRGGYHVVDVNNPEGSELLARIKTADGDDIMPPAKSGKSLTPDEISLLTQWVESGADWEGHWAYLPPQKNPTPDVKWLDWRRNPIDRFIGARLEAEGLEPSTQADRRTLIRRVFLDLTGQPPSSDDVEQFLNDRDRFAYDHIVDRLLASPHYGERMAIYWLDLVRYADTVGYHGDQDYTVWPYRDYVINSFNRNQPFDQFTREQLAGDLLPGATREQKVASGYNRLHMITAEGGAQDKEYLAKYAADRVRTTSTVWLGSTMGCAECHDHKFDPFTTKDFYSFAAFFSDLKERGFYGGNRWEPQMPLPTSQQTERMSQLKNEIARLESTLVTSTEALVNGQLEWENEIFTADAEGRLIWTARTPKVAESSEGATLRILTDESILVSGKNPKNDTYQVEFTNLNGKVSALRLEALTHPLLDNEAHSRGGGNFVLTDFAIELKREGQTSGERLKIRSAKADYSQGGFEVGKAIDDNKKSGWAIAGAKRIEPHQAVFTFERSIELQSGDSLSVVLSHTSKHEHHNIGRFRISTISIENPGLEEIGIPTNVYRAVLTPYGERSTEEQALLTKQFREQTPLLDGTRLLLAETKRARSQLESEIPTMLVSQSVAPRTMRVLPRGNWLDESGEVVKPQLPGFLLNSPVDEGGLTRMDLAAWLTSNENPLTARTFVNRLWKLYFGAGLSKVLDDVGAQGEWPTHPELLDWLAVEFMESGWDVKHLVKLLVTSQTYRQSSVANEFLKERDPYNRLYARQTAFRLDAEVIRDIALSVSGLRVDQLGGPSVKPYQPAGYYAQLNFPKRTYQADTGAAQYRRGLYTHWQRTFLHPSMKAFDAPSREECTAERSRSNTPLQSLALLNDPTYVEAARLLAQRIAECPLPATDARIRWAFNETVGRPPKSSELKILSALYTEIHLRYTEDVEAAVALMTVGDAPAPAAENCNPVELASWTMVSRAMLNLHEVITRY